MDSVFAQAQARQSGIIHEVDLDARAGFRARSGSSAYRGYDWWLLASQLDAVALEPDPVTVEMVRSYKPASAYTALCFGGDADTDSAAYARWLPWYAALHGMPAVWHTAPFGGSSLTTGAVALAPDGLCSPTFAEAADTIAELKSGLGALLLSAVRKKPAVAIYGSQASLYLSQIDPAFGDCRAAERAFMKLLEQAGRAYDFVSYAQARQGKLREYALAILPATRALSDEELEALRTFHAQGGRLIADIAPGEFDGHGIRRASYPLDGLFGIRHTGPPKPGAPAESFVELSTERGTTSGVLDGLIADSAVEPTDAVVSGKTQHGTPLWLLQGADKVATALLNHTMQTYPLESEQGALLFRLFDALLTRTGVECSAPAIAENGGPLPCACTVLHYGEADIVTLLRDAGEGGKTERVLLRFEDDRHVYDARQGKHLMRPKHVREDLRPGDARVLTALPYEVTGLTVTTEDSVQAGRRLTVAVSVNARKATPGTHLVHVTLRQGFGQPIPYYAHDVSCREGEGATFIPLALDEAPGVYTIEARDLLTGTTGQALLKVEGRTPPK
jgi:hypothetical protein